MNITYSHQGVIYATYDNSSLYAVHEKRTLHKRQVYGIYITSIDTVWERRRINLFRVITQIISSTKRERKLHKRANVTTPNNDKYEKFRQGKWQYVRETTNNYEAASHWINRIQLWIGTEYFVRMFSNKNRLTVTTYSRSILRF